MSRSENVWWRCRSITIVVPFFWTWLVMYETDVCYVLVWQIAVSIRDRFYSECVRFSLLNIREAFMMLTARKPLLAVAQTTLATYSSCELKLWPLTLTFQFDLDSVKMCQHVIYLGHRSFRLKVVIRPSRLVTVGDRSFFTPEPRSGTAYLKTSSLPHHWQQFAVNWNCIHLGSLLPGHCSGSIAIVDLEILLLRPL